MGLRIYSFAAMVALTSSNAIATSTSFDDIQITNNMSECSEISLINTISEKSSFFGLFNFKLKPSLANCGCKSAGVDYEAYIENPSKFLLQSGTFNLLGSKERHIVLTSEKSIINNRKISVDFYCSPPN